MAATGGTTRTPSFEERLKDIPSEKLDEPCTDGHLLEIAPSITDWQSIAPYLGLDEADEEGIEDLRSAKRKRIAVLRKWKQKSGRKGTYRRLAKRFWKAKRADLVDEVCRVLQQVDSSSSSSDDDGGPPNTKKTKKGALESYAEYLRGRYQSEVPSCFTLQWPPPPTRKVFNLAMIGCRAVQHGSVDEDIVRLTLRGNVDDIMKKKSAVELRDIFKLDNKDHKVILIEGAPGAGKSTLAWYICQKSQELFQDYRIVVFVQLRDPAIQAAASVANLLPAKSFSEVREVLSEMEACYGQGVLFVLDGWDEYSPGLRGGTLMEKLICKPGDLNLHHSALVITSRPVASAELQYFASCRIEIVGFTRVEVGKYFTEALDDPQLVEKLQEHLKERPVIQASSYLPLNAAIVAHLFLALGHTLPTTHHGVYTQVILCCIIRHLTKQGEESPGISSLDGLPPEIQRKFNNICRLAYYGIMENKVTFSKEDLLAQNLPANLDTLSLIQAVECFSALEKSFLYHFLHLSIQELLAAFHISKLEAGEQVRIFNDLFHQPRFGAVFKFYAAFTKFQAEGIREIVACLAHDNNKVQLNLLHCLYEAQDRSLCQYVASQMDNIMNISGTTLSPLDCLVVGYFVCSCLTTCKILTLDLHLCQLDEYKVGFLARQLSRCYNSDTEVPSGHLRLIVDVDPYTAGLVNCSPALKKLDLRYGFSADFQAGLCHTFQALTNNSSIIEMSFQRDSNIELTQESGQALCQMLQTNKTLKVLDFAQTFGPQSIHYSAECIAEGLKRNNCLQVLNLSMNAFGDRGIAHISNSLRVNCCLKQLNISRCRITELGARELGDSLRVNRSLEILDLCHNWILDSGAAYIFGALMENCTLKVLRVYFCGITDSGVESFVAGALEVNTSLEELSFGEIIVMNLNYTSRSLMSLGESLKRNTGLQTLKLFLPSVTRQLLKQFVLCLKNNQHLTRLVVCGVDCVSLLREEVKVINVIREQKGVASFRITHGM